MSLHRLIPDSELPAALKEPLVFGNRDQINALNALEADISVMETEQATASGNLKYFDVCIEYSGEQNFKVLAVDEADAEEKAEEGADMFAAEIDVDSINVREVKPIKGIHKNEKKL